MPSSTSRTLLWPDFEPATLRRSDRRIREADPSFRALIAHCFAVSRGELSHGRRVAVSPLTRAAAPDWRGRARAGRRHHLPAWSAVADVRRRGACRNGRVRERPRSWQGRLNSSLVLPVVVAPVAVLAFAWVVGPERFPTAWTVIAPGIALVVMAAAILAFRERDPADGFRSWIGSVVASALSEHARLRLRVRGLSAVTQDGQLVRNPARHRQIACSCSLY